MRGLTMANRELYFELRGVIADVEESGFDDVCLETIKRVSDALAQREWQGLTEDDIEDVCWTEVDQRLRSFARGIEAKLKEKNG